MNPVPDGWVLIDNYEARRLAVVTTDDSLLLGRVEIGYVGLVQGPCDEAGEPIEGEWHWAVLRDPKGFGLVEASISKPHPTTIKLCEGVARSCPEATHGVEGQILVEKLTQWENQVRG